MHVYKDTWKTKTTVIMADTRRIDKEPALVIMMSDE